MKTRLLTITLAAVLALLGAVAVLAYVRQANEPCHRWPESGNRHCGQWCDHRGYLAERGEGQQ